MTGMENGTKKRRVRRSFTDEFKAGAVRLVVDEGKTVSRVARNLDLTESALRTWVERRGRSGRMAKRGSRRQSGRN
jgi:transposase